MLRLYFLLFFISFALHSQNWKLVNPAYEVSFKNNLSTSSTIWAIENSFAIYTCKYVFDSETLQKDSTFKLYEGNNMFKIPSIFEEYILFANGDQKIKIKEEILTLPALYQVGQSWVGFESDQNYTVSCDSKTLQSFLGVVDSVYSFSVPNGTTIKLSKKYGLLEWTNSTTQISLFLAEKIKSKHTLFDYRNTCFFNEGYVYAGYDDTFNSTGLGKYARIRIEVSDKQTFQDHITYSLVVWEDYKTTTACANAHPQPCPWFYERNTIEVNVYKDQITSWERYYSPSSVNHAVIKDNDTILYFGGVPKFDTPDPMYAFSLSKGIVSDFFAAQLITMRNFEVTCYYLASQPVSCSSEFDLMTALQSAEENEGVAVLYASELLKMNAFGQSRNDYKLMDVSGRILISGEFKNKVEIPIALKPGLYRVVIQNDETEFSKKIVAVE